VQYFTFCQTEDLNQIKAGHTVELLNACPGKTAVIISVSVNCSSSMKLYAYDSDLKSRFKNCVSSECVNF